MLHGWWIMQLINHRGNYNLSGGNNEWRDHFQTWLFFWQIVEIHCFFLGKFLEILATNHSLSKRRDIFVPQLLELPHVLIVLQLAWMHSSPQLSWITQSGLAPYPGCQDSCGMVPNGSPGSNVSFNICQGLKC